MIQLSTTDPLVVPMKPPMAAPEKPKTTAPNAPPIVEPTAPRTKVTMCGGAISAERQGKGDLARPRWCQGFLDHAQSFMGVDETVRAWQDADMLGDGARGHAEQDKRTGTGLSGHDFRHHRACAFGEDVGGADFTAIPAVGWDGKWLAADNIAPDAARDAPP